MTRVVAPEFLDELPAEDPHAVQSRRDLVRLNWWMGSVGIVSRALRTPWNGRPAVNLVELGAGDGKFLLRVARRLVAGRRPVRAVVVDQRPCVRRETVAEFSKLGWTIEIQQADVFDWFQARHGARTDVMFTNLFLHHFGEPELRRLLAHAAMCTACFVACEPRRSAFGLAAARCLRLLGCNAVTRHDAVVSVRAGFAGQELRARWPRDVAWCVEERPAGWFSHLFAAHCSP